MRPLLSIFKCWYLHFDVLWRNRKVDARSLCEFCNFETWHRRTQSMDVARGIHHTFACPNALALGQSMLTTSPGNFILCCIRWDLSWKDFDKWFESKFTSLYGYLLKAIYHKIQNHTGFLQQLESKHEIHQLASKACDLATIIRQQKSSIIHLQTWRRGLCKRLCKDRIC